MKKHRISAKEKTLILDLICKEQMLMISKSISNVNSDKYIELEKLKIKLYTMK